MSHLNFALTSYARGHSGTAVITGVVRELTQPVAKKQIFLIHPETMDAVRETRSASNGTYSFANIATGVAWIVLGLDPAGAYNAVVADRVQT